MCHLVDSMASRLACGSWLKILLDPCLKDPYARKNPISKEKLGLIKTGLLRCSFDRDPL